jgi:predicted Fe-Mo cluster-binding NifX family protein
MSRLCIPTEGNGGLDARIGEHFGRVPTFTIVDSETGDVEVVDNTSEHMGGRGLPAELLAEQGVDVMLCSGLGRRAIGILDERGIEVHVGLTGTVRDVVAAWKGGGLAGASEDDACQKHAFKDRH